MSKTSIPDVTEDERTGFFLPIQMLSRVAMSEMVMLVESMVLGFG